MNKVSLSLKMDLTYSPEENFINVMKKNYNILKLKTVHKIKLLLKIRINIWVFTLV